MVTLHFCQAQPCNMSVYLELNKFKLQEWDLLQLRVLEMMRLTSFNFLLCSYFIIPKVNGFLFLDFANGVKSGTIV